MFGYYLKIFYRNLLKEKLISLISLISLSFSFAITLLILDYYNYHNTFDNYAENGMSVVRVYQFNDQSNDRSLQTFAPIGPLIKQNDDRVKNFGRLYKWDMGVISAEEKKFRKDILYGDPSLFRILPFQFLNTNPEDKFEQPNTVVISKSLALKYFGTTEVVGESINFKDWFQEVDFEIVGVFKDMPKKLHVSIDLLVSFRSLKTNPIWKGSVDDNWESNSFYTYFLVEGDYKNIPAKLNSLVTGKLPVEFSQYLFDVQNVEDVHLNSNFEDELASNADNDMISFLTLIGIMIMIIAIINLVNYFISNVVERVKEVGVKKAFGVSVTDLRIQFLLEFIVFNVISLLLGVIIFYLISRSDYIEILQTPGQVFDLSFWLLAGGIFLIGLILSGSYPSIVLASIRLDSSTKNTSNLVRKVLMIFQYAISIGMIYTVIIVNAQFRFIKSQDIKFNKEDVLVLKAPSVIRNDSLFSSALEYVKNNLAQFHAISAVSASSAVPGADFGGEMEISKLNAEQTFKVHHFVSSDYDFNKVYRVKVLAGRFFNSDFTSDKENAVIINKTLSEKMGYETPEDAIGEKVKFANSERVIVGVLDDFHIESLKEAYMPVVFHMIHHPSVVSYFSMAVKKNMLEKALEYVSEMYEQQFNQQAEFFYIEDSFNQQYGKEVSFYDLFRILTGIAILLAVFGLIGLSFYFATKKAKDIAIRKVFGASSVSIFMNLFNNFIFLILFGSLLSLPLFYYLVNIWLENYAFRIDYSIAYFVAPMIIIMLVTLLATGFTLYKASVQYPIVALKEN